MMRAEELEADQSKSEQVHFTLYGRSYCHLCDDLLQALLKLRDEFEFEVAVIDIDTEAAASVLEQFDELVPVLLGRRGPQEAERLCHYFLDEARVRRFLNV